MTAIRISAVTFSLFCHCICHFCQVHYLQFHVSVVKFEQLLLCILCCSTDERDDVRPIRDDFTPCQLPVYECHICASLQNTGNLSHHMASSQLPCPSSLCRLIHIVAGLNCVQIVLQCCRNRGYSHSSSLTELRRLSPRIAKMFPLFPTKKRLTEAIRALV